MRISSPVSSSTAIRAVLYANPTDVVYDFYGERRKLEWLQVRKAAADHQVATCSADQKIKVFRKSVDGVWELEAEWKVRQQIPSSSLQSQYP